MKLLVVLSLAALCAVGDALPARAAPADAEKQARKWFGEAELAYRQREFQKALRHYKKAQEYKRHPALLFNIAQCHRQLKQWVEALFYFKLYLSEVPKASNRLEVQRYIEKMTRLADQAKALQTSGRLSVVTRPAGAEVRVDSFKGPALGKTPTILRVSAGAHLVQIRRSGFTTVHRTVAVKRGTMTLVEVRLMKEASAPRAVGPRTRRRVVRPTGPQPSPRAVTTAPPHRANARRKRFYATAWFWTGTTASLAMIVTGGVLAKWSVDLEDRWERNQDASYDVRRDLQKKGRTVSLAADVLMIGGGVAAVGVLVWAILHERGRKRERPGATTWLRPSCSATGCAVSVGGQF